MITELIVLLKYFIIGLTIGTIITKIIKPKPTKKDLLKEQNELLKKQIKLLEQDRRG